MENGIVSPSREIGEGLSATILGKSVEYAVILSSKKIRALVGDVITAGVKKFDGGFFQGWMSKVIGFPL